MSGHPTMRELIVFGQFAVEKGLLHKPASQGSGGGAALDSEIKDVVHLGVFDEVGLGKIQLRGTGGQFGVG